MKPTLFLLSLVSTFAWAAPDRQFICKYADIGEVRAAYFISVKADGTKLTSLRYEHDTNKSYDLKNVIQYRYSRDAATGQENLYVWHDGGGEEESFTLEFSGVGNMPGKYTQWIVDSKGEQDPGWAHELPLSCQRLL